jgi:hypothetical protein
MKLLISSFVFYLALNSFSLACDILSIDIGADKSEIEEYIGGAFDDEVDEEEGNEDEVKPSVIVVSGDIENFCNKGTFGFAEFKAYIADDKIAGVAIQVSNGEGNEESKKKLLYKYVVNKFGAIENSDKPNWIGYKVWQVGGKEVTYYKMLEEEEFLIEELQVTNSKFRDYIIVQDELGYE